MTDQPPTERAETDESHEPPEPLANDSSARPRARSRRRLLGFWRLHRIKRGFIWTHRWTSLVIGLALLVVTTSGVPLLYAPELKAAHYGSAFHASGAPATLTLEESLPFLQKHDPAFAPQSLHEARGVYIGENFESGRKVTLDPASGRILGDFNPSKDSSFIPKSLSLLENIHLCMLTCDDYVGYQAWLNHSVPGTTWLGFDGEAVTWGGLILGITGVLLLFLAVSGIWLWWPGIKRFAHGVRVRTRKGRYARDYDLHQVAGMVALPLLLVWAFTGTSYEFNFIQKAWYGAVPGSAIPERSLESARSDKPDIGVAAAVASAQKLVGSEKRAVAIDIPAAKEKTATYGVWIQDGFDPWGKTEYAGDVLVSVDRHSGNAKITYGGDEPKAQALYEDWNYPTHSGYVVGPWWRIAWLVLGLSPLLLAITGISTWLYKRGRRKRRRSIAATA